jgi:hypothetical protein
MRDTIRKSAIMINDHSRLLAREVIAKACQMYVDGTGPEDLAKCREAVLNIRWPVRGSGGVAHANLRTQREVSEAIREFYQPSELSEPM